MQPVTLRTSRLELSIPVDDDIDRVVAACQDPDIVRWTTVPAPYTRADAEAYVAQAEARWATGDHLVWAVRLRGRDVGSLGLHGVGRGAAEIGYWMAPGARGRGLLTEAARAVVDWGFSGLGLARIEWRAGVGNLPSARVARWLGFRFEGTLRGAMVNSLGRSDSWVAGLLASDDRTPVDWSILSTAGR